MSRVKKPLPMSIDIGGQRVTYYRVDNDRNGNPRYVIHYSTISDVYTVAYKKARACGLRVYLGKWISKGFVMVSYSLREDLTRLIKGEVC